MRSLLLALYLSIAATLIFLCLILFKEFGTPNLPAGSSGEPVYTAPKNKISFSEGEFMKIGQATGLTFTLSEARTVSHKELQCLAKNIYHEARGEGIAGMMGIAQITLNRSQGRNRHVAHRTSIFVGRKKNVVGRSIEKRDFLKMMGC